MDTDVTFASERIVPLLVGDSMRIRGWHHYPALVAELGLERVRVDATSTFGAFFCSKSRSSASVSSSKRTKVSPRGDKVRCDSRTMAQLIIGKGRARENTTSWPPRTSAVIVFSGNKPTASVFAVIFFIIASESQVIAGNGFAAESSGLSLRPPERNCLRMGPEMREAVITGKRKMLRRVGSRFEASKGCLARTTK